MNKVQREARLREFVEWIARRRPTFGADIDHDTCGLDVDGAFLANFVLDEVDGVR
jgi:methylaspartate ammonia-lyase